MSISCRRSLFEKSPFFRRQQTCVLLLCNKWNDLRVGDSQQTDFRIFYKKPKYERAAIFSSPSHLGKPRLSIQGNPVYHFGKPGEYASCIFPSVSL